MHDHPALATAAREAKAVVPLFVLDDGLLRSDYARPNRVRFLLDALEDLDRTLATLGGALAVRRGDVIQEAVRMARQAHASAIFTSADVSAYAQARQRRLEDASRTAGVAFRAFPGITVVPPDALAPAGGDHFRVFTPYWRKWSGTALRPVAPAPRRLRVPPGVERGTIPPLADLVRGATSPELPRGGETSGRARARAWIAGGLERYGERHDDLAGDATSRLSPFIHFGCLSPRELVEMVGGRKGAEPFVRQLCWRDFYHQVTAARPAIAREDYRPRGDRWRRAPRLLEAWKEGRTGYPIVDAGMRQLAREGWMHNRARLIVASFLVKDLYLDWRLGARHFLDLLVDGDIASNSGNWQWVAGTGNDTRPNRVFNPTRQAARFDPGGEYVRRYVPELASIGDRRVHQPWALDRAARRALDYPPPIVDHHEAAARFQQAHRNRG